MSEERESQSSLERRRERRGCFEEKGDSIDRSYLSLKMVSILWGSGNLTKTNTVDFYDLLLYFLVLCSYNPPFVKFSSFVFLSVGLHPHLRSHGSYHTHFFPNHLLFLVNH